MGIPKSAGVLKAGMKRGLIPRFIAMWELLTILELITQVSPRTTEWILFFWPVVLPVNSGLDGS